MKHILMIISSTTKLHTTMILIFQAFLTKYSVPRNLSSKFMALQLAYTFIVKYYQQGFSRGMGGLTKKGAVLSCSMFIRKPQWAYPRSLLKKSL
ncbi:hypothetical protein D7Z54_32705 [Salibacterium salarium]|uniref:Uncharacterized protein n=1 Tax=Salibacterium salarium TaxID=284579 RepID=A0A3R9PEP5_9BACI|nr:hypothetical protein D7Z54_32705 [Salibacterium salarium]